MPGTAVPSESPAAVSSKEDADLSAAFGPLFGALLKELLTKIVPAETAVLEGVVGQCSSLAHLNLRVSERLDGEMALLSAAVAGSL